MKKLLFCIFILMLSAIACEEKLPIPEPEPVENNEPVLYCAGGFCAYGELVGEGKIYEKNDRAWLWAGTDSSWHFDITNWIIDSGAE
ncbi:MAG: hypothetical protein R3B47_17780 [Bacteroidia bacterium]